MCYSKEQIKDLEATIESCVCDTVLYATPIDLPKVVSINKPTVRVRYEYKDHSGPTLEETLIRRMQKDMDKCGNKEA